MEKKRVLIVDDDKVLLEIARDVLTREGYSVFTSNQALGTSHKVVEIKPHLILIDVIMPGLAGDMICKILKESYDDKEMKIILYSVKDQDELKKLAAETGADDFLTKSSNYQELVDKVNFFLKNT